MDGWIKLHRKLVDNPLWHSEPFTRGQAWVDMILLASHKETYFYVRGIKINLKRGQLAWSEVKLSERWGWSRNKLRKFLNDMENEQQIKQQKSNVIQIITVVNYRQYQQKGTTNDTTNGTTEGHIQECKERKEEYKVWLSMTENGKYKSFINWFLKQDFTQCLKLNDHITEEKFNKLIAKHSPEKIQLTISSMENKKDLLKKYKSFYLTLNNWLTND